MFQRITNVFCLIVLSVVFFVCVVSLTGAAEEQSSSKNEKDGDKQAEKQKDPYAWKNLFDGKSLDGWKAADFGGAGDVKVKDGTIVLPCGESLTGVVYKGKTPTVDYEITLDGMRLDGSDFFATTTFPFGKTHCSLVVGGWGGTVVGLSNVDYYDAGDNITTRFVDLKKNRWYRVRLRVCRSRIEAWIDDDKIVDLPTANHKFGTRFEVDACKPLGIASWCTSAALRNIRIRQLKPEEVAAIAKRGKAEVDESDGEASEKTDSTPSETTPAKSQPEKKTTWQSLFDGKTLGKWEIAKEHDFQAHGPIGVSDGIIAIKPGSPGSGIRWSGEMPRLDYELALEAKRTEGYDFFCGLTFPIDKAYCTLILGGWGGSIVGLSNIDGASAAENSTSTIRDFKKDQWCKIRLRVTAAKIEAWIDDAKVIDQETAGHKFAIWPQQEPLRPLGIATWETGAGVRNIRLRNL